MQKRKFIGCCLLALIISLLIHMHAVAANEGSAQAEVLNSQVNVQTVSGINLGKFYPAPQGQQYRYNFRASGDIVADIQDYASLLSSSHRGGHGVGRINLSGGTEGQSITVSSDGGITLTNGLLYTPYFQVSDISSPQARLGKTSLTFTLGNGGTRQILILGRVYVGSTAAAGTYSGSFPINITYN